jgi:hypothetical protein
MCLWQVPAFLKMHNELGSHGDLTGVCMLSHGEQSLM